MKKKIRGYIKKDDKNLNTLENWDNKKANIKIYRLPVSNKGYFFPVQIIIDFSSQTSVNSAPKTKGR
jgi:hypothetical protein